MNILIRDVRQNKKIVAKIYVNLSNQKYIATANQYFEHAWSIAVEQCIVSIANKRDYEFEFANEELGGGCA